MGYMCITRFYIVYKTTTCRAIQTAKAEFRLVRKEEKIIYISYMYLYCQPS